MQASVTGGVTPVYAAPETFDGWVSRFCDQYSLAIVYQELLTGPAAVQRHQRPPADPAAPAGARPNVAPLPAGRPADHRPRPGQEPRRPLPDLPRHGPALLRRAARPAPRPAAPGPPTSRLRRAEPAAGLAGRRSATSGRPSTTHDGRRRASIRRGTADSAPGADARPSAAHATAAVLAGRAARRRPQGPARGQRRRRAVPRPGRRRRRQSA